jgi:hypothetical protein
MSLTTCQCTASVRCHTTLTSSCCSAAHAWTVSDRQGGRQTLVAQKWLALQVGVFGFQEHMLCIGAMHAQPPTKAIPAGTIVCKTAV